MCILEVFFPVEWKKTALKQKKQNLKIDQYMKKPCLACSVLT